MPTPDTPSVLVIDDEPSLRLMLRAVLAERGWRVLEAPDAEAGLELLAREEPDVVLCDMKLPGMDGMQALRAILADHPGLPVVMLTAYGTVGSAVEAMKQGAYDYLTKPADNDELEAVLSRALQYGRLTRTTAPRGGPAPEGESGLIGQSPAMLEVKRLIEQVGPSEATVLVTGESGTGKELVAERLHTLSLRRKGPLVKVNCAALPGELLESELFGYVKGAFTGAVKDKPGRFQLADGGTLFLDEIGELPLTLQAKLLRALQERTVEPLGAVRPLTVDVRILAATNRDLRAEVAAGRFREDLYFRLNVIEIPIPPLRERNGDIALLAAFLIRRLGAKNRKQARGVSPEFLDALVRYDWPGNVRELENVLERALILARSDTLGPELLPPQMREGGRDAALKPAGQQAASPAGAAVPADLDEAEKLAIERALAEHGGHRERTADALGISRRTLQYKLRKYGLARR